MQHASVVTLPRFDYELANRLGVALCNLAILRELPVGVEVFHGTSQVFLALLPGARPDNIDWVRRKRSLVMRFHQSSLSMRLECEAKGVDFNQRFALSRNDFVASGGGVPVALAGSGVVGCVAVSGLPDTEDDALAREALEQVRNY